ncbi:MAG: histidine phosphatase family protein [Spirochaetales bacterium]|nr:histidine phosphatase family protein [Candidatus Physcosoma equi]
MGVVYFVRHGESEWNVLNRICGSTDSPLTERGHEMAEETGRKILEDGIKADYILYSPLSRAAETARHISERTGIPRREELRLVEQNFGKWEGTSPRNAKEFQEEKKMFVYSYEGGESMMKVGQRIYNLLDELKADSDHTYILVAHNGIARIVNSYFHDMTNEEFSSFGVPNCSVTAFEF